MQGSKSGTAMALFAALGVGLGAAEAAAQQVVGCDAGSNGYVSADEAAMCAERDYSTILGDQEVSTRQRFEQAFAATENVDEMWADADANQDGQLSRAEWSDWSARRFRSASPRVEGLLSTTTRLWKPSTTWVMTSKAGTNRLAVAAPAPLATSPVPPEGTTTGPATTATPLATALPMAAATPTAIVRAVSRLPAAPPATTCPPPTRARTAAAAPPPAGPVVAPAVSG
jgi:hypothetical protein